MKTTFQVWYMKHFRASAMRGEGVDPKNLPATHVHLRDLELEGGSAQLERVFHMQQAEEWSPNGEARELIRAKGLYHTSMSIGDVVVVDGEAFVVASFGFKQLSEVT